MTKLNRALLSTALLLATVVGGVFGLGNFPVAHAASVPAGLPSHFGIGVSAAPNSSGLDGWMPNSNVPWDYAYQYLAGGVNTNNGWETWNSSGQFPLYYAQDAASHHYIPVFSYYDLLQSNGSCNSCGESQKDISNLNNAATMASYYQNFALLMKRLGSGTYDGIAGFGKTAIVQVEPDLSGYAEQAAQNSGACYGFCTSQGNNPAYLKAAVAGSGDADVANYPNTYQGFNWALLHLRDLYAPNVLLATHLSTWADGVDIGSSSDPSLNAAALGQEAGQFLAQAGVTGVPSGTSSYDLVFNDVLDRDAGYYKYVYGDASRWWDRLNVSFPNFHRWESYVGAAHTATNRPVIVWQIPEGNQYFDTDNNTNGHYQDNRAEYFFGHIAELQQAGIIGLLFGSGNGGSTNHTDSDNDGVTNPASICTSDGLSSGQICNNHTSSVADDDGGYIRMQAQAYYAGLAGATATPTVAPTATGKPTATATPKRTATATPTPASAPTFSDSSTVSPAAVAPGATTTIHTTITDHGGALSNGNVDIEVYNASGQKMGQQVFGGQNLATNQSAAYSYTWTAPSTTGTYTVMIGVFDGNWTTDYFWDASAATVTVTNAAVPTSTATPKPTATATPKPTATASATPTPKATATAGGGTTLGDAAVGSATDDGDANNMNGSRITTAGAATVASVSAYVGAVDTAPHNQYQVAIYTDQGGRPGTLVAKSGTGTLRANSWNTLPISAALAAHTSYWLVYNTNGASGAVNNLRYDPAGGAGEAWNANPTPFGAWPAAFGPAATGPGAFSLYATTAP